MPEVEEIAARHSKSSAQVLLRHLFQKGLAIVPKSTNPKRIRENIDVSTLGVPCSYKTIFSIFFPLKDVDCKNY